MSKELNLDPLKNAMNTVIAEGRLGKPAFFRFIAQSAIPNGELSSALADVLILPKSWFGANPQHTYRMGSGLTGQITTLTKWPGGQGAFISLVSIPPGKASKLHMVLLGGNGAAYYQF